MDYKKECLNIQLKKEMKFIKNNKIEKINYQKNIKDKLLEE